MARGIFSLETSGYANPWNVCSHLHTFHKSGLTSGYLGQATGAVAIGNYAGYRSQGTDSVAIGTRAGITQQNDNTVIISASGTNLNSVAADSFYIAPLRAGVNATSRLVMYDTSTSELWYSSSAAGSASKTFVIQHPNDSERYLVHACLEGPEVGVYYRGTGCINELSLSTPPTNTDCTDVHDTKHYVATIKLPAYVKNLACDYTVHVTPVFNGSMKLQVFAEKLDIASSSFRVHSSQPCEFTWIVYGKRATIDVEPHKRNAILRGNGPYTWLE